MQNQLGRFCAVGNVTQAHHIPDQAKLFHHPDRVIGRIELPPAVRLASNVLVGMVVIVPPLAERQKTDPPIVATIIGRLVTARTP